MDMVKIFYAAVPLLAMAAVAPAEAVTVGNDAIEICFAGADNGFAVTSIVSKAGGGARFVHTDMKRADFWKLTFAGAGGTNDLVEVDNHCAAAKKSVEQTAGRTVFRWFGIDLPGGKGELDVAAEITAPKGDAATRWRLQVANRSKRYGLFTTAYPYLREVARAGEGDVLRTGGSLGGRLFRRYAGDRGWEDVGMLPSTRPPVYACMIGGSGLYVGAHDPDYRIKRLVCGTRQDFRIETPVENAGRPGMAANGPGFAVTVAAFGGDWWQAAKIYRKWALRQKWAAKGPIAGRADYPRAMCDVDMWDVVISEKASVVSNEIVRLKRHFPGLKLGIHWYFWHNSKFDTNFPEFFPAKPGVKEAMEFGKREGVVMMPYTNPRLWDDKQASWEFARHAACTGPDGSETIECYQGRSFGVMCPHGDIWKKCVDRFSRQVLDEAGANAIYYDQVTCAPSVECYNPGHGHPVGGGSWWTKGYREMLEGIHAEFAAINAPITSERMSDAWLDLIDGYLAAGAPPLEEVPFWPAVYSGYTVFFGSGHSLKDDPDAFAAYQIRRFAWGVAAGWFDRWMLGEDGLDVQRELLARTAHVRRRAEDFMIYGTLEGEVPFVDPPQEKTFALKHIWRTNSSRNIRMPELFATHWRNLGGTAHGIAAGNAKSTREVLRLKLPAKGFRLAGGVAQHGATYREADGIGELTLPPRGIAFLRTDAE